MTEIKCILANIVTNQHQYLPPMSILLLVAPLVAPHNTITIGENRKEHTKRWLTGEESRKDHNRSTSTSMALLRTVQTLCNMQSVNKTNIGKVMNHRDQGRFEGE